MIVSLMAAGARKRFSRGGIPEIRKEALEVFVPREKELFYGARAMGWVLLILGVLMILGVGVISIWDGFKSGYTFIQFFLRFVLSFTIYKAYDMIFFD